MENYVNNIVYSGAELRTFKRSRCFLDTHTTWKLKNLKLWKMRGVRAGRFSVHKTHRLNEVTRNSMTTYKRHDQVKKPREKTLRTIECKSINFLPSVLLANVRSINNKIDEVEVTMNTYPVQIGVLTETWLDQSSQEGALIEGFNEYHKIRSNDKIKGGGVSIFIKKNINVIGSEQIEDCFFDAISVTCRPPVLPRGMGAIVVIGIYFPPNNSVEQQNALEQKLYDIVDKSRLLYSNPGIFLCGDFNTFKYNRLATNLGLKQIVKSPTRGMASLDLIFTNIGYLYLNPECMGPIGSSDHSAIFLASSGWHKGSNKHIKWIRKTPPSKKILFGQDIISTNWNPDDISTGNIDSDIDLLYNWITCKYNKAFPLVKVTIEEKNEWVTSNIIALIKQRSLEFKRNNILMVKKLNLIIKKEIIKEKKKIFKRKTKNFNKCSNDYYKFMKDIVNSKRSNIKLPNIDEITLPDLLNSSFNACWTTHKPLDKSTADYILFSDPVLFSIGEVCNTLKKIKLGASTGPSAIPNWVWKEFAIEFSPFITNIFNTSICTGTFPNKWKYAIIVPKPKINIPIDPGDFRPISLTDPLSKILERLVYKRLMSSVLHVIDIRQYGGVAGRSTSHYLLHLLEWIHNTVDIPKSRAIICFIDFMKAYDLVDHNVVVNILLKLNVPGYLVVWICSFLSERYHKVRIGTLLSGPLFTTCGVPQGTLIGGLLFVILVNGIAESVTDRWKYIDDLTIGLGITGRSESTIAETIKNIDSEGTSLGMRLNLKKTKLMQVSFLKDEYNLNIVLDDFSIPCVKDINILGVVLQDNLKWDMQVERMVTKASKRVFIMYKLRKFSCGNDILKRAYCTYIRPILEYGAVVWHGSITVKQNALIESVQKRIVRIILSKGYTTYADALSCLSLLTLKERREKIILKIGMSIINNKSLRYILPDSRNQTNEYALRNSEHISKITCRTTRRLKSPGPTVIKILNSNS